MNEYKQWTVTVEEDENDLILPFPQEMLKELDWQEGDVLIWTDNSDGTFSLKKQQYDSDSGVEGRL